MKYSLVKLMENEGDDERPSSGLKATYNLVLTPKGATTDEVEAALTNPSFLGIYMSNLRNRFQKQYEEKFGTVYDRRAGRKPPVTKAMENEFYASLLKDLPYPNLRNNILYHDNLNILIRILLP